MSTAKPFTLAQMQRWMQSALIQKGSQIPAENPASLINESRRLTAARHLSIYRQSYIARLRECMKNQFSALAYALGEELFQMFADQYLEAYPSESYTLNDLGERFPAFLEATRPDAGQETKESWIDFIIQLATFEYTLTLIFDEHSVEQFSPATESTPDEHLKLAEIFRLYRHSYPICRYYLAVTRGEEPELPFEEHTFCVVTRINYRLSLLEINPAQYYFLTILISKSSIAKAREDFLKQYVIQARRFDDVWPQWKNHFVRASFFRSLDSR